MSPSQRAVLGDASISALTIAYHSPMDQQQKGTRSVVWGPFTTKPPKIAYHGIPTRTVTLSGNTASVQGNTGLVGICLLLKPSQPVCLTSHHSEQLIRGVMDGCYEQQMFGKA